MFFKRKTPPCRINHNAAIKFLVSEIGVTSTKGFDLLEHAVVNQKKLKCTRKIVDGLVEYRFKIPELAEYFNGLTPLSPKKIKKQLQILAGEIE